MVETRKQLKEAKEQIKQRIKPLINSGDVVGYDFSIAEQILIANITTSNSEESLLKAFRAFNNCSDLLMEKSEIYISRP
jgi:hypothetical protein